jgi:predicted glutamine amidotransferase
MHNGDVADFSKIKRLVRRGLVSDEIYSWIKGQTDSEHFSAMFLDNFIRLKANYRIEDFAKVFRVTLDQVNELRVQHGITEPALINFVVSDGKSLLAARYTSAEPETASTLYYMTGGSLSVQEGVCHMLPQEENRTGAVLVVSEKLDAHGVDWKTVPVNHLLLVNDDLSTSLEAI